MAAGLEKRNAPTLAGRGVLLLAVAVAQLADLVTLRLATFVVSMDGELNPFIRAQYAAGGFDAVVVGKLGWLAVMLVGTALLSRSPWPVARYAAPGFAIAVGLFGALVNLTTFLAAR